MPLPANGALSLQGYSRPGDTVHSKPKQAMIIRMSTETFEALEAFPHQPPMDFEFGENPGIYIGETFFRMRQTREPSPHELYLRTSSAAKPMAPLKLYANVSWKFTVERELGEKIEERVRDRTIEAENQRTSRTTKLLEVPPPTATVNGKKRKAAPSSMFRKPQQTGEHVRTTSTNPLPSRVASPMPPSNTPAKESLIHPRKRLIHCLAVLARTSDDAIRLVGGANCDPTMRKDLFALLEEVAEQTDPVKKGADKSTRPWHLKTRSWLEVRPWEWPYLNDTERTNMARQARLAYNDLNIPKNDSAWNHVLYRATNNTSAVGTPTASGSGTPNGTPKVAAAKRGVSSKEVKERKAKEAKAEAAARPKVEVQMKDESAKAAARAVKLIPREKERDTQAGRPSETAPLKPPNRRVPGSGFKSGQSLAPDSRLDTGLDATVIPAGSRKLAQAAELRANETERGTSHMPPNLSASAHPPLGSDRDRVNVGAARIAKKIKDVRASGVDSDRERERGRDTDRDTDRERERDRDRRGTPLAGVKRKKVAREDVEGDAQRAATAPQKRRKTEEPRVAAPAPKAPPARDLSLPKKPETGLTPRQHIRQEPSPLPPSRRLATPPRQPIKREQSPHPPTRSPLPPPRTKAKRDASPIPPALRSPIGARDKTFSRQSSPPTSSSHNHSGHQSSRASAAAKSRRRSPIYTTSEDEGEIRRPNPRDTSVPAPLPTPPSKQDTVHFHRAPRGARASAPLPTDRASLRARYDSSYLDYLTSYQRVVAVKRKIEGLLRSSSGSAGSLTDSDGEADFLDPEELFKEHKVLENELLGIRQVLARSPSSD